MNDQQRQMEYANDQHDLACITLEIGTRHDDCDDTLFEAVVALMKERDVWKHESENLSAELKKADEALEANITTFLDLREERDEAREIAKESCEMLAKNGFETNYPPMPWDSDSQMNAQAKPCRAVD